MTWRIILRNFVLAVVIFLFGALFANLISSLTLRETAIETATVLAGLVLFFRVAAPIVLTVAASAVREKSTQTFLEAKFFKEYFIIRGRNG